MTKPDKPQRDRFIEKARELGCDEDEGRFNETLKRIAPKVAEGACGGLIGRITLCTCGDPRASLAHLRPRGNRSSVR